jgi:hypothetical protein
MGGRMIQKDKNPNAKKRKAEEHAHNQRENTKVEKSVKTAPQAATKSNKTAEFDDLPLQVEKSAETTLKAEESVELRLLVQMHMLRISIPTNTEKTEERKANCFNITYKDRRPVFSGIPQKIPDFASGNPEKPKSNISK